MPVRCHCTSDTSISCWISSELTPTWKLTGRCAAFCGRRMARGRSGAWRARRRRPGMLHSHATACRRGATQAGRHTTATQAGHRGTFLRSARYPPCCGIRLPIRCSSVPTGRSGRIDSNKSIAAPWPCGAAREGPCRGRTVRRPAQHGRAGCLHGTASHSTASAAARRHGRARRAHLALPALEEAAKQHDVLAARGCPARAHHRPLLLLRRRRERLHGGDRGGWNRRQGAGAAMWQPAQQHAGGDGGVPPWPAAAPAPPTSTGGCSTETSGAEPNRRSAVSTCLAVALAYQLRRGAGGGVGGWWVAGDALGCTAGRRRRPARPQHCCTAPQPPSHPPVCELAVQHHVVVGGEGLGGARPRRALVVKRELAPARAAGAPPRGHVGALAAARRGSTALPQPQQTPPQPHPAHWHPTQPKQPTHM